MEEGATKKERTGPGDLSNLIKILTLAKCHRMTLLKVFVSILILDYSILYILESFNTLNLIPYLQCDQIY